MDDNHVGLVYSPADTCNCQTRCDELLPEKLANYCFTFDWSMSSATHSYRMINYGWDTPCYGSTDNC